MDRWEINIENTVRTIYLEGAPPLVLWYTATGSEGNAIVVEGLENKYITSIDINRYELEPVDIETFPENDQYSYNNLTGTVTLKQDLEAGDKIKITYRAIL